MAGLRQDLDNPAGVDVPVCVFYSQYPVTVTEIKIRFVVWKVCVYLVE